MLLLLFGAAYGAEFDVGAAMEGVAHIAKGTAGAGARQLELDARLGTGGVNARVDLDVLVPTFAWETGLWADVGVTPEWAQLEVRAGSGWSISGGVKPLDSPSEAVDGWRNRLAPWSRSFERYWPGQLLGVWADGGRDGLTYGLWGGARGWPGAIVPDHPAVVVGGAVAAEGEALRIAAATHVLPVDLEHVTTAALEVPLDTILVGGALWLHGWPGDAMALAGSGRVELFPEDALTPVARLEYAEGWSVDGGVAWRPQSFVQLAATGRVEGDRLWLFAQVALFEDPEQR